MKHLRIAFIAAALPSALACSGGNVAQKPSAAAKGEGAVEVSDALHGAMVQLPPFAGGWQIAPEGGARASAGSVNVEVASFPMAKGATAAACRDTARARLSHPAQSDSHSEGDARPSQAAAPPLDPPREQTIGDAPTATWSFTRGAEQAPVRSRWAFYARGADCLMLQVSAPRGDGFAEIVFGTAARSLRVFPLPPERQREVDLLAGMGFLERREPASALERFEALARRETSFAKAHFGALMAGFEMGPKTYARALPHGEVALKADRDLTPEQRQLALRAVGVMQLAENHVKSAAQTLAELVVRAPDLAEGQYNYACALARLGDKAGALEHLRTAFSLDEELTSYARKDEDLQSLHGLTEFEDLVGDAEDEPSAARPGQPR